MQTRNVIASAVFLVAAVIVGAVDGPGAANDNEPARHVTDNRNQLVVFTGDLIRLTLHDQSVTEGYLVSMGKLSLTLSDTTDTDDQTKVFFTSIEKLEVSRGDSMICLKAYAVDSSWLSFSDITPPDSIPTVRPRQ